ncbi:iron-containing alcohol dehydrogenase family protein [Anaerobacillus isosaccharinicus]|uniref:Glycerol dehydrogenase n=1 Tax=Anaerobacillus isosaccharinicus TaxID=1532552 RepID=A0A1S2LIF2_9BACI|nr:iron-containing alcohol dehydrogenase family protein [Anaerobacillus isosaccharinicus]MBA5586156.1 iron-containing alcohol dehydrogenase family protein [Anaerobacillus isosaccharinicus]QOY35579.1 iron-containing alcohol dehydrogenase family protein [Anaerobacillus isosaccharinicus]
MLSPVTSVPIPAILEIKNGAVTRLGHILKKHDFSNAVIIFDDFTYETFKDNVIISLHTIEVDTVVMPSNLDIQDLIKKAFAMPRYDVVIAMGGGSIIDYGKYIAYSRRSPFISIPTSASNDGFASSNCSIHVEGKKTTVPAKVPFGIIADLEIIQHAPEHLILAGIGDLISNITALYDWEFEEKNGASHVNAFASMLSKKAVNSFIRTPMTDIKNSIFLKELISSATMGGIATAISGNSSPISGSEHLISHALDKISVKPQMHGIQVGVATYIMANVQNHRALRIKKVFERTGFFDYVKGLGLQKEEYVEAIKMAPSIKPNRYTFLHDESYQQKAILFVREDDLLQEIFQ